MYPTARIRKSAVHAALAALILCSLFGAACQKKPVQRTKTGFYFDTVITITLYQDADDSVFEECFAIADKYEKLFSATIPSSEISQINRAGGAGVTVSDDTASLLQKGLTYCELSDGGFDITIGTLSSLWDFSAPDNPPPDKAAIARAVSTVDYRRVKLEGNHVTLFNPDAAIDLGGIAKGYIADRMKERLNELGVTQGTVNLGGNVLCLGPQPDGESCRIGIQMPFEQQGVAAAVVEVTDQAVVSSGTYERYITEGDTVYHHILNPATGYPYENGLLSVSIICASSADADGLSTACFALGRTEGLKLIESLPETEAVFITKDRKFYCSSGIGTDIPFEPLY